MLSIPRIARNVLDWLIIAVMLLVGSLVFGVLGNREMVHERIASLPLWEQVVAYAVWVAFALWLLCPLAAFLLGFKRRMWAGIIWLLGATPAYFSAVQFFYVMDWRRSLDWFIPAILVLVAIGLYWLITAVFKWPPMLARSSERSKWRKLTFAFGVAFICASGLMWTALIAALSIDIGDCRGIAPPYAKPRRPEHALFVATDVLHSSSKPLAQGEPFTPFGLLAISRVQEHFWGLPWWDQKYVLMWRPEFHRFRQTYLIDAHRSRGLLAQFLPVVTYTLCGRSRPLEDAEIDLRVLKDGKSRLGARIIGYISRQSGETRLRQAGIRVAITGPAGNLVSTTDAKGVYDFPGLYPGSYTIHFEVPTNVHVDYSSCPAQFELTYDEIIECDLHYSG